jgi:hypothetical protein
VDKILLYKEIYYLGTNDSDLKGFGEGICLHPNSIKVQTRCWWPSYSTVSSSPQEHKNYLYWMHFTILVVKSRRQASYVMCPKGKTWRQNYTGERQSILVQNFISIKPRKKKILVKKHHVCMDLDCFLYRILIQYIEQYTLKLFCFFLRNQSFIIYKIQILPLINSYISLCKNYEEKKIL